MNTFPKISIITPNFNGVDFLERTIKSVLNQGYPNLEYIIIDGGSKDKSTDIINKYSSHLAYWESTPDHGLYHALQKGFERSSGEIMGWINSDDLLQSNSLFSVAEIFALSDEIQWVQGYPTVVDERDRLVYHRPPVYRPSHFYEKAYHDGRFIQQESTFWKRTLWNISGGSLSRELKFAGDFELWMRFFQHAPLYVTTAILGSFRTRITGQISKTNFSQYLQECDDVIDKLKEGMATFTVKNPKMITFNFTTNKFRLD